MSLHDHQSADTTPDLFGILSSARRQYALSALHDADGPLALSTLAEEVVAQEQDEPESEATQDQLQQCKIELYHNHVPKLANADVVEFDVDQKTVALNESSALAQIDL